MIVKLPAPRERFLCRGTFIAAEETGARHLSGSGACSRGFVLSPEATELVGVDVGLSRGGQFPVEGTTASIRLRAGGPSGSVLGEADAFVAAGPNTPVHFDFDPPIPVAPGQTYVIEWINHDMGPIWLSWLGHAVDSYPPGEAYHCFGGTYDPTVDFNFNAYRQVPDVPATSGWGSMVLALLLLTASALVFRRVGA